MKQARTGIGTAVIVGLAVAGLVAPAAQGRPLGGGYVTGAYGAPRAIGLGPQTSGVFARMSPDGRSLALLDGQGHPAHTLRAGAGLVAATSFEHGRPVWVVTGTDVRGLSDAAESLQQGVLRNRFALVTDHGKPLSAPER